MRYAISAVVRRVEATGKTGLEPRTAADMASRGRGVVKRGYLFDKKGLLVSAQAGDGQVCVILACRIHGRSVITLMA